MVTQDKSAEFIDSSSEIGHEEEEEFDEDAFSELDGADIWYNK